MKTRNGYSELKWKRDSVQRNLGKYLVNTWLPEVEPGEKGGLA